MNGRKKRFRSGKVARSFLGNALRKAMDGPKSVRETGIAGICILHPKIGGEEKHEAMDQVLRTRGDGRCAGNV